MKSYLSRVLVSSNTELKPGKVLISQKQNVNELLNKSLILLLEHDETGSTGIILNKRSISFDNDVADQEPLFYGGTYDTHRIGIIRNTPADAGRSVRIAEGIYYCERCELLNHKNFRKQLVTAGLKAFMGFTVWEAGELESEIAKNCWRLDEFDYSDLKDAEKSDIWERKNLQQGNVGIAVTGYGYLLN